MGSIEGFVLAGGKSRRMGRNKMNLIVGGHTLIERAAVALSAVASPVFAVGNLRSEDTSLPIIRDEPKGHGSIVGLYTALLNAKTEWAAIAACDLPFVSGRVLRRMVSHIPDAANSAHADIDAILAEQADGRIQPLFGLYRVKTCLAETEAMLSAENWRLQDLVKRVDSHILRANELSDIIVTANWLHNVNTPEDLREAVRIERDMNGV